MPPDAPIDAPPIARNADTARGMHRAAAVLTLAALLVCAPAARGQILLPDGFNDQLVLAGLSAPVGMAWLPDGRMFVIEQKTAKIRLLVNGALAPTDPVATVDNVRTSGSEQGLLGIAVDPGWPARPYIYVHCDNQGTSTIRVSRYTVTGDLSGVGNGALAIDVASRYDLIDDIPDQAPNHNGGTLRFGNDGFLYGSFGDDASGCPAQTPGLRGVILRMDVSRLPAGPGGPAPRALIIPPGNPFPAAPDSNARLVWAYGLRNPFRFAVDAASGNLWIGDVGENRREEVDYQTAGGMNFGWPRYEGTLDWDLNCAAQNPVFPIDEYTHDEGAAVIGGFVYRRPAGAGDQAFPPSYEGDGFYNDYYTGYVWRLKGSGAAWQRPAAVPGQPTANHWAEGFTGVSDWLIGPAGRVWYCRQGTGQIRRIVAVAGNDTTPPDTIAAAAVSFERPFPVPAIGEVNLRYTLSRAAAVSLVIYDFRGARVRTLVDGRVQDASTYDVLWRGIDESDREVPPGIYFARLVAGGRDVARRIPLIR